MEEAKKDAVPLLAAGVAFYAFLALVPTLIALILLYGLVSEPADVAAQVESFRFCTSQRSRGAT